MSSGAGRDGNAAERCDVTVIGAGLLGMYAAWRLAAAGMSVVVFDKGLAGGESTGRSAGGIRRQFASDYEIGLTEASLPFFAMVEADADFPGGIDGVGYAFLAGPTQEATLACGYAAELRRGIGVHWLEPARIAELVPYCDLEGISAATFCADDGFINAWDVHQWVYRRARALGVTVRQRRQVTGLRQDGTGWLVETADGWGTRCARVVLAAGAWTGELGRAFGMSLPVVASPRVKVRTDRHPQLPAGMPLVTDLTTGAYVRSEQGCALIGATPHPTPVGFRYDTSDDHLASIVGRAIVHFPTLQNAGLAGTVCGLYEMTPDRLPLAGPVDGFRGCFALAGFNGHGIMHGPGVADALCALIVDAPGHNRLVDLGPLAPDRFVRSPGRPLVSFL